MFRLDFPRTWHPPKHNLNGKLSVLRNGRQRLLSLTLNSRASMRSRLPIATLPYPYVYVFSLTNISFVLFLFQFSAQERVVSRPPTPALHTTQHSSRPATPTISLGHPLHPKAPVQTPEQFYDWLALIDRSVTHSQDAHFRAHLALLTTHLSTCERLINGITEVDDVLGHMYKEWWRVEENGRIVKEGCERLVEERVSGSSAHSVSFSPANRSHSSGPAAPTRGRHRRALGVLSRTRSSYQNAQSSRRVAHF